LVIAMSETATAIATVDGLFAAVAVVAAVESKGVEVAQSPLPVTAVHLVMGAERLGEVDMIGVFQTMTNVGDFGGDNAFLVPKSFIPT
jgi:hypothetical protein